VKRGKWIVPAGEGDAAPVWGVEGGLSVGLWPMGGPRGLLRVYTPYLGQPAGRMINFIAVEPIVAGRRGLSEIEPGGSDGQAGKLMWTADRLHKRPQLQPPWRPAQPKFVRIDGAEAMTLFLYVEPFRSGAHPIIQITLRQDRPHEVALRVFSAAGGAEMDACVLTATMGNYARLRRLWLSDGVLTAASLWPDFKGAGPRFRGFARPKAWGIDRIALAGDEAVVAAVPDERDPARATYARGVPPWWRYVGRPATQYWRTKRHPKLRVRVNARRTYWGTTAEIPGGIAFENFELIAPFQSGQEFRFGVTDKPPQALKAFRKRPAHAD
jgi:hypothetical protein